MRPHLRTPDDFRRLTGVTTRLFVLCLYSGPAGDEAPTVALPDDARCRAVPLYIDAVITGGKRQQAAISQRFSSHHITQPRRYRSRHAGRRHDVTAETPPIGRTVLNLGFDTISRRADEFLAEFRRNAAGSRQPGRIGPLPLAFCLTRRLPGRRRHIALKRARRRQKDGRFALISLIIGIDAMPPDADEADAAGRASPMNDYRASGFTLPLLG